MDGLGALGIPAPPERLPTPFSDNRLPKLRYRVDMEARAAILNVVQARVFNMPEDLAMRWLLDAHVLDHLTPDEWGFIACGRGERARYADQLESLYAVSWLIGLVDHLDPALACAEDLPEMLPDLRRPESFSEWRDRHLTPTRDAAVVAEMLDFYYCLDWVCDQARRSGSPLPRGIDDSLVWHRRWALEWAVHAEGHRPLRWDEVRL
ncbi:DUF4272 domain-containing protein [Glycomyces arizonensis]|uniref:DUF4272 domain-containing protein n=1 Tax=Glycomyces arizonensis TaxID=256035 RepID=UPI0006855761|nr:DUF4272 domain-containing protein [Glycomyces arizonensis]